MEFKVDYVQVQDGYLMGVDSMIEVVRDYWNNHICETEEHNVQKPHIMQRVSAHPTFSKEYFQDIENRRYFINPEIHSFAQFTRYRNKKVLEIGVGSGCDFVQWCRAGANAYGIDLTPNGIEHATRWLESERVHGTLQVANAEALPFDNSQFDLVYSWGVLHHSPNPLQAISEAIRVTKPGGEIKLMLYNRHSFTALGIWGHINIREKLFPKSLAWSIAHGIESLGTQAFTTTEVRNMLEHFPVEILDIKSPPIKYDYYFRNGIIIRTLAKVFHYITGSTAGFFMTIRMRKNEPQPITTTKQPQVVNLR